MSYNIVLVDDEPIIIESLKKIIASNFPKFKIVGEAGNGNDAYYLIKELKPHIALVDIQMPFCDGLELIKAFHKESSDTSFVLLTAHREFEYAKEAISLGVKDYLLKPLRLDSLKKCFNKITSEIDSISNQSSLLVNYKNILPETIKHNWIELLNGKNSSELFQKSIKDFLWNMKSPYILYMLSKTDLSPQEFHLIERMFYSAFRNNDCFICHCGEHIYFLLSDTFSNRSKIVKFRESFLNERNPNVFLYESGKFTSLNQLKELCSHLAHMAEKNFYYGYTSNIINETHCSKLSKPVCFTASFDFSSIVELLRFHKYEEAKAELSKTLKDIADKRQASPDVLMKAVAELIRRIMQQFTADPALELNITWSLQEKLFKTQTIEAFASEFKNMFEYALEKIQDYNVVQDKVIETAYTYCSQYYYKDISLDHIALKVHMSKNYFCTYFKKKTGLSFYSYLTQLRIDIAKEYLLHSNKKIADIATETGYMNTSHFGKLFKEITGMTPIQYREKR